MRLGAAVVLCGAILLPASGGSASGPWYIHTVDSDIGFFTWGCSLALDARAYPHISYSDHTLWYAGWNGSSWNIHAVDSRGLQPSLALDDNGHPRISYYRDFACDLMYATWNGSGWDLQMVDGVVDVGRNSSLALDANGYPHISYCVDGYSGGTRLKYAAWNGSGWDIQMVDSEGLVGYCTSLAVDANGYPHIAYTGRTTSSSAQKYAAWDGSGWHIQTVSQPGHKGSLALDASGRPHICWLRNTPNGRLVQYAAWNGTSWNIQSLAGPRHGLESPSLALDARDSPHICYLTEDRDPDRALEYAAWNGTTWDIETVDVEVRTRWDLQYTSLAVDADGFPHIASYSDGTHPLFSVPEGYHFKYATTRPPAPATLTYDLPTAGYYMLSLPLLLGGATLHDLLCDDLGHAPGDWYVWPWDAHSQAYEPGVTPPACLTATPDANSGSWLLAPAGPLDIGGSVATDDQVIPLKTGWNIIGSLYAADVDNLLVSRGDWRSLADAQALEWVLATFYYFHHDTNRYRSVTVGQSPPDQLSLWDGYLVLAGIDCSLIVPGPSSPLAALTPVGSRAVPPAWAFDIEATTTSSADTITIAAADTASDAFDGFALDKPKPPRPPGGATLRMVLSADAASQQAPWASDLAMETRSAAQGEAEWHFTVSGGLEGEPVTVSWPALIQLPKDHTAILTGEDTGRRTSMRTRAHYEVPAPGDGASRNFTVTVKRADQGALLITGLTAAPTRGSTWDVGFNLSADAAVDARIHNIAGRVVANIAQDQQLTRGRASLTWNGRSLTATRVPSGAYLLRVTARTEDGDQASAVTMLQMRR